MQYFLSALGAADTPGVMSVAWSRFDADVEHLKRLSLQLSDQVSTSVPSKVRSQSRRQSAANRRAIAGLQLNVPSPAVSMSSTSGSGSRMSEDCQTLQRASARLSWPSTSSTTAAASPHVYHPTVCRCDKTPNDTVQQSCDAAGAQSDTDIVNVTWTDQALVDSLSHPLNKSLPVITSAGESDVSAVSAVTSTAVTPVSMCQQASHASHGVSTEAETSAHVRQLSAANHHQTEGCKTVFYLQNLNYNNVACIYTVCCCQSL